MTDKQTSLEFFDCVEVLFGLGLLIELRLVCNLLPSCLIGFKTYLKVKFAANSVYIKGKHRE